MASTTTCRHHYHHRHKEHCTPTHLHVGAQQRGVQRQLRLDVNVSALAPARMRVLGGQSMAHINTHHRGGAVTQRAAL